MEDLIQCKGGPEPLKSKGLRDSSLFSAVVLIVEKGWISMRSRQMGAYQHTKSNGHTIPEMNRVTVKWERVIVYQESCDSGCFNRSGLFSALFGPTCRLHRAGRVCAQPGLMRGNRGARVAKAGGIVNRTMSKLQAFLFLL